MIAYHYNILNYSDVIATNQPIISPIYIVRTVIPSTVKRSYNHTCHGPDDHQEFPYLGGESVNKLLAVRVSPC